MNIKTEKIWSDYIEAMAWTEDMSDLNLSEELEFAIAADLLLFLRLCDRLSIDLDEVKYPGYDLWLTRNHHGAGFWDRGYDPQLTQRLCDIAEYLGEHEIYRGDDGKLY